MTKVADINLRTVCQQSTPVFHYYHRDHLGNNCAVWNATADSVVQRTLYYAGGMPMAGSTGQPYQPYKYNGKEFVTAYGYDTYDYGFRNYYPAVGRFTSVDPLAEKYYNISPYAYCANNPVISVDPNGMWVESLWDATNVAIGVSSFIENIANEDYANAAGDAVGVVLDVAATFLPFVPGGAGTAIKAMRSADKVANAMKTVKTVDKATDTGKIVKTFDGGLSTNSQTSREALRKAKEANGIPRSQQPDKTTKVLDKHTDQKLTQFEYTNTKGEKVTIRKDNPYIYPDGGSQGPHYNADKTYEGKEKLKQHHNYE